MEGLATMTVHHDESRMPLLDRLTKGSEETRFRALDEVIRSRPPGQLELLLEAVGDGQIITR